MYIFAKNATEIADDKHAESNSRYSDDSNNYSKGFGFDFDLNSALFNGIMHRISNRINEILQCDASKTNILVDRFARYNSKDECIDNDYNNDVNYIKHIHFNDFFNARIKPKLLFKDSVNHIFQKKLRDKSYLDKRDATSAIGLFVGTDLPISIIRGTGDVTLEPNRISLFTFPNLPTTVQNLQVNAKIEVKSDNIIYIYKTRITKYKKRGVLSKITPSISFSSGVKFRGVNVSAGTFPIKSHFEVIIQNNNILSVSGIDIDPDKNQDSIFKFVSTL